MSGNLVILGEVAIELVRSLSRNPVRVHTDCTPAFYLEPVPRTVFIVARVVLKSITPRIEQNSMKHNSIFRRGFFGHMGSGLGGIALAMLLKRDGLLRAEDAGLAPIRPPIDPARPFGARPTHFEAKAKNVIVIFCSGACSQLDTFDYKPALIERHGQPMPGGEGLITFQGENGNLTRSPWEFKPRGQCGKFVSDLVPDKDSPALFTNAGRDFSSGASSGLLVNAGRGGSSIIVASV